MKIMLALFTGLSALSVSGQITLKNNPIRQGDEIIKQQVEYKDPGRAGENVVWNFGQLNAVNPEYKLKYYPVRLTGDSIYIMGRDTFPKHNVNPEELVIGVEHRTMYYYRQKDDSLLVLGHENPVTLLHHKEPVLSMTYPFNYKQKTAKGFSSSGLYSSREEINTKGDIQIESDAYGMMILPSKDTLQHVLRVKSIQTILEADRARMSGDNPLHIETETYRWYAKGYRYPVFETIRSFNVQDTGRVESFSTAFFYPPQNHYYLSDDPENLTVLDSLWNEKNKYPGITGPDDNGGQLKPDLNFAYNYYPNPVENDLHVEYYLQEVSLVTIALFDINGKIVKSIPERKQKEGLYYETIDCSILPQGSYILRFTIGDKTVNEKILKK